MTLTASEWAAGGDAAGWYHDNPALIHWEYDTEAVDDDGKKTKGYWTSNLMLDATNEFLDLFEWLYGEESCGVKHIAVVNMDWSSNHAAMDVQTVAHMDNFKKGWGHRLYAKGPMKGQAKVSPKGDNANGSCTVGEGDLGPNVPEWSAHGKHSRHFKKTHFQRFIISLCITLYIRIGFYISNL